MTGEPEFIPILPAHAIERCGISVLFDQPLPEKIYTRLRDSAVEALRKVGLAAQQQQGLSIMFDTQTGNITPQITSALGPTQFVSNDGAAQLFYAPNSLVWHTNRYIRWDPFISQFESVTSFLLDNFLQSVSLASIQIEYWDRFLWTGKWNSIAYEKLLDANAPVSRPPAQSVKEWHSHAGWFERSDGLRRLINVNVDASDYAAPTQDLVPSVGIYTMLRDEMNAPGFQRVTPEEQSPTYLMDRLEKMHVASKNVLASTITGAMKDRIGLFPGPDGDH
ncbi:uncharacterized protein (TIGR04255 family) [Methylobacterium sp. RAS18]|nr:uncharacterized protein (TIGR04255 family) [Methylobacterium sp. RAS18]